MRPYDDRSAGNAIVSFHQTPDAITIAFKNGTHYTYSHTSCGAETVSHMKRLATMGAGLGRFIREQKPAYAKKR